MNFEDLFTSSFLDSINSVSLLDIIIAVTMSFIIGLFIFFVYKHIYKGIMYSSSFGVTLIALTMITTIVIMAVTSNVVLSLGMVGALSIVRFRAAIKEPLDIAFLFWSISVGIILAAGIYPLAVFGSIFIGIILMIFANWKSFDNPYILMVNCKNQNAEAQVEELLKKSVKRHSIKSKSIEKGCIELNFDVCLKDENTMFINSLSDISEVINVALVSYNGDYMG